MKEDEYHIYESYMSLIQQIDDLVYMVNVKCMSIKVHICEFTTTTKKKKKQLIFSLMSEAGLNPDVTNVLFQINTVFDLGTLRSSAHARHSADDRFQKGKHNDTYMNKASKYKGCHIYFRVKRVVLNTKQQHGP